MCIYSINWQISYSGIALFSCSWFWDVGYSIFAQMIFFHCWSWSFALQVLPAWLTSSPKTLVHFMSLFASHLWLNGRPQNIFRKPFPQKILSTLALAWNRNFPRDISRYKLAKLMVFWADKKVDFSGDFF